MKIFKTILILGSLLLLSLFASQLRAAGGGDVKIGYIYLDETGNQSSNHSTFNDYEGAALSLENFRFDMNNGSVLRANLRNLTLNNRNLNLDYSKSGLFSIKASHDKYRRIYNFEGTSYTKREHEEVAVSVHPIQFIELFGGGAYMKKGGTYDNLFNPTPIPTSTRVDYKQSFYNGGVKVNYRNSMVLAEYRGNMFRDNLDATHDQDRSEGRVIGLLTVPRFERLQLNGGFRHFESKYKSSDFTISNNRGWGGATLNLPYDISVKYQASLDRTSSDSDYVATDNLSHAFYVSHTHRNQAGVTLGYIHNLNDYYQQQFQSNSLYAGFWVKPSKQWDLRYEFGNRHDDVKEGLRLVGNEDNDRHRATVRYRPCEMVNVGLKFESKIQKNDDIGSKTDFKRASFDGSYTAKKYFTLSGGYSYSKGDYQNVTQDFEFTNHLVYGDISFVEFHKLTPGFGFTYYRSKRDLDVESFNLRFSAAYSFYSNYRFEAIYNVHNFDDFLVRDQYYTANIVEINLVRGLSF